MDFKIYTDIQAPLHAVYVSLQKSDPYCNTLETGAYVSCSKSVSGLSKDGGVFNAMVAKNPKNFSKVESLVGDTRKSDLCHCHTRTGSGHRDSLEISF
jgi:hypothetical protein